MNIYATLTELELSNAMFTSAFESFRRLSLDASGRRLCPCSDSGPVTLPYSVPQDT